MRSLKPDRRNMKKHLLCRGMLPFGALGENHSAAKLAFVHPRLVRLTCGGGGKFLDTSCLCDALCGAKNPKSQSADYKDDRNFLILSD